jgi:hypothetical protein
MRGTVLKEVLEINSNKTITWRYQNKYHPNEFNITSGHNGTHNIFCIRHAPSGAVQRFLRQILVAANFFNEDALALEHERKRVRICDAI